MITQEQVDDAVLALTGLPEWNILQQALNHEIYQCQASSLDVNTWEEVCALRGYAKGLAFVINLRDMVTKSKEQESANATL